MASSSGRHWLRSWCRFATPDELLFRRLCHVPNSAVARARQTTTQHGEARRDGAAYTGNRRAGDHGTDGGRMGSKHPAMGLALMGPELAVGWRFGFGAAALGSCGWGGRGGGGEWRRRLAALRRTAGAREYGDGGRSWGELRAGPRWCLLICVSWALTFGPTGFLIKVAETNKIKDLKLSPQVQRAFDTFGPRPDRVRQKAHSSFLSLDSSSSKFVTEKELRPTG